MRRAPFLCQLTLALASLYGCRSETDLPLAAPPLGSWPLSEITGEIETVSGGSPVVCSERRFSRLPAPLYDSSAPAPSALELKGDGRLEFVFAFEWEVPLKRGPADERYQLLSNTPGPFSTSEPYRAYARELYATRGAWSWPQRQLSGTLEIGSYGDDAATSELHLLFEMKGQFDGPTAAAGTWNLSERSRLADCWSHARGQGKWSATVAPRSQKP